MRYKQLLELSYNEQIGRAVKDALVAIRIRGIDKIKTQQVLDEFKQQGMEISLDELIYLLSQEPMVRNVNADSIEFESPENKEYSSKDKQQDDSEKVSKLAKQALNKRT